MKTGHLLRYPRFLMPFLVRPRLPLAAALALVVYLVLPGHWRIATRLVDAWMAFVVLYFAFIGQMIATSTLACIRRRAPLYDVNAGVILILTLGATVASLGAIVSEIATVKQSGLPAAWVLIHCAVAVTLSWSFVHVMYALHYAHDFYSGEDPARPPLVFPGTSEPMYGDFLYFSFVIGCACATADVNITDPAVRRLALVHGVIAFFFNAAIVAMFINLAAGLLGG